jgi:hypothetical protein
MEAITAMVRNVPVGARIERDLLERVRKEAKDNRRNLGQEIASLIEEALARREHERREERRRERAARQES